MRYKMMGGIEQGIHYTTFQEDVEDANQQDTGKKEGTAKSYGETEIEKLDTEQPVLPNKKSVL
jgi:hypothetical protein